MNSLEEKNSSFISKLIERRIPHVFIFYVLISWGILNIIDYFAEKYYFSPYLPEFVFALLLLLIPVVLVIAFNYGITGDKKWSPFEKVIIPINFVAAIVALFFMFQGKDLGSTLKTLTLRNEDGKIFERIIPKSEFRKNISMFMFANDTGNPENDWLKNTVPNYVSIDLSQDLYFYILSPPYFQETLIKEGYPSGVDVPLNLRKKIANDFNSDYYVFGNANILNDEFEVQYSVYEVATNKLKAENKIRTADFFNLIDQFSVQLKKDLEIPQSYINRSTDLPINEISTGYLEAARHHNEAQLALLNLPNWNKAIEHLEKAVDIDTTFALALFDLQTIYSITNQTSKRGPVIDQMLRHIHHTPERYQYLLKAASYEYKNELDKQLAVVKISTELYPEDIVTKSIYAQLLEFRNDIDGAIEANKDIYELDPKKGNLLIKIGDLYLEKGDYYSSEKYYTQFTEKFPDREEGFVSLAKLKLNNGDFETSELLVSKARLLDQNNIETAILESSIIKRAGNYEEAGRLIKDIVKNSKNSSDSLAAFKTLSNHYQDIGKPIEALSQLKKYYEISERQNFPVSVLIEQLATLDKYVKAGKKEEGIEKLAELEKVLKPPYDLFIPIGKLVLSLELGNIVESESAIQKIYELIENMKLDIILPVILRKEAEIAEAKNDPQTAIDKYLELLKVDPSNTFIFKEIAKNYIEMGNLEKAGEYISKVRKVYPYHPDINFESAKYYLAMQNKVEALKSINRSLEVWKDAEPIFQTAIKARELKEKIEKI